VDKKWGYLINPQQEKFAAIFKMLIKTGVKLNMNWRWEGQ